MIVHFVKSNTYYCFDIDNTLADTWHSYQYKYKNTFERHKSLAVFVNMRQLILKKIKNEKVIFLSSRQFYLYLSTYFWLRSVHIPIDFFSIFLVSNPNTKIKFIKHLLKQGKKVIYIDDMSYNHENGNIKQYDSVINELIQLESKNFKFLGYDYVQRVS